MQVSASHAPIMSRSLIRPCQFDIFKYCYSGHKGILADKEVEEEIHNINSSKVRAWVKEEELRAVSFTVFMSHLSGEILAMDWEWEMAQVLTKKQGKKERFMKWLHARFDYAGEGCRDGFTEIEWLT
ncbi:hypothetical protein H2248_001245 [Termitomyces sp. 'cryptogamus']|nr:hypothetical protein H2248_001245 [Termitomyces sp. 'cryptogamus']